MGKGELRPNLYSSTALHPGCRKPPPPFRHFRENSERPPKILAVLLPSSTSLFSKPHKTHGRHRRGRQGCCAVNHQCEKGPHPCRDGDEEDGNEACFIAWVQKCLWGESERGFQKAAVSVVVPPPIHSLPLPLNWETWPGLLSGPLCPKCSANAEYNSLLGKYRPSVSPREKYFNYVLLKELHCFGSHDSLRHKPWLTITTGWKPESWLSFPCFQTFPKSRDIWLSVFGRSLS